MKPKTTVAIAQPHVLHGSACSVVGAAVMILAAGGVKLTERGMYRASNASQNLWRARGEEIMALVRQIDPDAPAGQDPARGDK